MHRRRLRALPLRDRVGDALAAALSPELAWTPLEGWPVWVDDRMLARRELSTKKLLFSDSLIESVRVPAFRLEYENRA
jgi:hypothetical protein